MGSVKSQHYVPQFFLRRFSTDGKSINLFNIKRTKLIPRASISGQCSEDFFYDTDNKIESLLQIVEGVGAETLRSIEHHRDIPTQHDHEVLINLIALQLLRTRAIADQVEHMYDHMVKHAMLLEGKINEKDFDGFRIVHPHPALPSLSSMGHVVAHLLDMQIAVLGCSTPGEFITSDSPIVLYNQFKESETFRSNVGYANRGLQIIFPISPSTCIFLYDPFTYKIGSRKNKVISQIASNDLHQINLLQYVYAQKNIYFQSPDTGLVVERLHKENESLRPSKFSQVKELKSRDDPNSSIFMYHRTAVNIRLNLSFISKPKIKNPERFRWGTLEVRNPRLCEAMRFFEKKVEDGVCAEGELLDFLFSNKLIPYHPALTMSQLDRRHIFKRFLIDAKFSEIPLRNLGL